MKFIAMDMDGTLLNNSHSIPKENLEAIKLAQSKGVYAVISTGRVYEHVIDFINSQDFEPDFIISSNGACITDKEGNLLVSREIPNEIVIEALNFLHKNDYFYSLGTDKGMISPINAVDLLEKEAKRLLDKDPNADTSPVYDFLDYIKSFEDIDKRGRTFEELLNNDKPVYSIPVLVFDKERLNFGRNGLSHIKDITLDSSAFNNFEIVSASASKGISVSYLLDMLNISPDEAMAIGDNYNDISMFKVVKYSIAMDNSPEDVKAQCYATTKSNIEFGVAHAIKEFIL
ncbi:MAG: HAD family hydrolase [Clostridium sp.]